MEQAQLILTPQYVRGFSCVGGDCEDTCCSGWNISVDQHTYKKYRRLKKVVNPQLKSKLGKYIVRNRSKSTDREFAKIKLDKSGSCPFLDNCRMCSIQNILGEDYLSTTCRVYPRITNKVEGKIEMSGTMSCPEMARLALLNPNLMEFDYIEALVNMDGIQSNILEKNIENENNIQKHFWEMRIFTIQILQNRDFSLADRLIILGMFYRKVQEKVDNNRTHLIPNIINETSNKILNGDLKRSLGIVPKNVEVQITLIKGILETRYISGITNKRFLDCLNEFIKGVNPEVLTNQTSEQTEKRYKECFDKYYKPYMENHEYILENYLVNYVFRNLFPLDRDSVFDSFAQLTLNYSMIKLLLVGMSGYYKELNENIVIKCIQSFAKVIEHSDSFMVSILSKLKENGLATMAYMTVLIKN